MACGALLIGALLLGACGGSKATATPNAAATPNTAAPAIAATTVATVAATAVPATSTAIPATPTPLAATSTALVATGTALSATSIAFIGSATPSSSQTTTTTTTTSATVSDPQAQAIVDKARARFDQVNALHFALTVDGDVYLDTLHTQKLKSADGDLIRPDRVSLTAKASIGPVNASLKFIQIGDQAYLTNILTGKWEKAPSGFAYDPRVVFDQNKGVTAILSNVRGWTLVGTEKINGVDTQHVRGPVPVASVNDLVSSSLRGDNVDVDLYVEPKNNDTVRFVLSEQPSVAAGTTAARWILDLSKQNDSGIKIDAPTVGG